MSVKTVSLVPAKCAMDLGDGSERALYVNQDYLLRTLGRPMRSISLMYCYYPLDEGWPVRASEAFKDKEVSFAWDYPYDDYFTYKGGLEGNTEGEPFTCMRDVRRHGQDVTLTMTVDPHISDDQIRAIAKDLKPFGRIILRLNHECTGNWFSYTKRASYQEIADFFSHFADIIHEEAPNVKMLLCAGMIAKKGDKKVEKEDEFKGAIAKADMWSVDNYLALNWGWPYEVAERDNNSHRRYVVKDVYDRAKATYKRYKKIAGKDAAFSYAELNADGDVTGPYDQCLMMEEISKLIKKDKAQWLKSYTMYQFRDDGRLGLEITDPNNSEVGVPQPLMDTYKKIIHDDFFKPGFSCDGERELPITLRWGGSEDAEGIAIPLTFEKDPVFAEANFNGSLKDANLMMELNGMWFYKAPGKTFVDFMPAFFGKKLKKNTTMDLHIFAPPATGENDPSQGEDWLTNYYYELKELPDIRLRFDPIVKKGEE